MNFEAFNTYFKPADDTTYQTRRETVGETRLYIVLWFVTWIHCLWSDL